MYRSIYSMVLALGLAAGVVGACDNRREDTRGAAGEANETGARNEPSTSNEAIKQSETGNLSEADKKAGRTLETPGDSIRLEDTLSIPPASSDTTR